ncbi:hypothetical protein LJR090_000462 [Bosea sp. LjRoot90]|uniref:hypothetical protein n=1 Tax=Bosea sp. LjRoot90 TaxID=3342342 RepID=UPI003ECD7187
MDVTIEHYDDYSEVNLKRMSFYSHGDERNFYFLLDAMHVQVWAHPDVIQIAISKHLAVWQREEIRALFRRYSIPLDAIQQLIEIE